MGAAALFARPDAEASAVAQLRARVLERVWAVVPLRPRFSADGEQGDARMDMIRTLDWSLCLEPPASASAEVREDIGGLVACLVPMCARQDGAVTGGRKGFRSSNDLCVCLWTADAVEALVPVLRALTNTNELGDVTSTSARLFGEVLIVAMELRTIPCVAQAAGLSGDDLVTRYVQQAVIRRCGCGQHPEVCLCAARRSAQLGG
jgi:hypothetical protein